MLIGIVIIQAWWIDRYMDLKAKAFDDAVYKSLAATVKQVNEKENFTFINHQLQTDTMLKRTKNVLKLKTKRKIPKAFASNENVQVSVISEPGKETRTIVRVEEDKNGTKTIKHSVVVGAAAYDSMLVIATPPVPPVPPVPGTEVLTEDVKREDLEIILEKMLKVNDPDSISVGPAEVKKILSEQVKLNHLPEGFDLLMLSKDPKRTSDSAAGKEWKSYKANLYPNDLFGRNMTLVLMYPFEETTLKRSDWMPPILLSLFFTLSLLALFIYSIYMLIRHKKMLEQKNDFINHMSHEFKTPLTGISLGADMLIAKHDKMDAAQAIKVAQIIRKQSERLNKEVNDVLLNAQLEESIPKNPVAFDLVAALKTQLEMFHLQLEEKQAKIEPQFYPEHISIVGDEILWQKVFSNLLDNALKFSKESPVISVKVQRSTQGIHIEFADNGIGIDPKDLPYIFDKFYRSNYYKQSNIQGFGLGLSFVKKVVDSHKGIIKAESEIGKGTKIIIELND